MNGDKMIDILDIQSVVDAYGTKDTSIVPQDLNQDGVVDETDIRFVEKNFLTKGPDAPADKQPKESLGNGKKGLEYFLRLIGLEPKNNKHNPIRDVNKRRGLKVKMSPF